MKVSRHFNSSIKLFLTMLFIAGVTLFSLIRSDLPGVVAASPHVTKGNTSSTCGSWSIVPSPIPSNSLRSKFNGVAAISSKDVWAVGSYFVKQFQTNTLTEHWNGSRWSIIPSPNPNPGSRITDDELFAVAAVSSKDVWASGIENNLSLIEHWDGTQWKVVPSPEPFSSDNLSAIAVVSSNDVWIVGDQITTSGELTLIEHWDGTQWSIVPSPSRGTTGNRLLSVTAVSSNDIWATGWNFDNSGIQQTLIEHWNGTQWSIVASPNVHNMHGNILNGVTTVSSQDVWTVGFSIIEQTGSYEGQTLIEHWNGTKWQIVTSPNPEQGDSLNSVAALSANDIWATGEGFSSGPPSQAFIEHWDGTSWQAVSSPQTTPPSSLKSVAVVPGTGNLWTVGSTISPTHPHVIRPLVEFYC